MRLPKSFCGLIATLSLSACGSSSEPKAADAPAPAPSKVERDPKPLAAPPNLPEPKGPAGLLQTSPAETWEGTSLRVQVSDLKVLAGGATPKLAYELLVLDEEERPITTLSPEDLALTLDGLYVPGTWQVQTFREAGRGVAVGILLPAHSSFAEPIEDGGFVARDAVVAGARTLIGSLADQDRVALMAYSDKGLELLSTWGQPKAALDGLSRLPPAGDSAMPPDFFRSLAKLASLFLEHEAELPARRILLNVSDAIDRTSDRAAVVDRRINEITELAASANVWPWLLGFTLASSEPLVHLKHVASKGRGRYHEVSAEDHKALAERFASFGAGASQGFVVTLTPAPGVRLPESANTVRLVLRSSGGVGRATSGKLELGR